MGFPRLLRSSATALLFVAACASPREERSDGPVEVPAVPEPMREFRAVWVATVANIDWPSRPGLPVAEQQAEALAILDRVAELNMNAVVFQVRPQADALYASELEPWSAYLTGTQGRAPEPFYDPLRFWVEEAHARGLELHAWFNPYRADHPANPGALDERSVVKARPGLVVKLGTKGYYWMDPALPAVQDHSVAVVLDVVDRYDVDGVHFDDYFYPYPSYNDGEDFPDDASYAAYRRNGGTLGRGDWRRAAVDGFIRRLDEELERRGRCVKFGISPFGIWRPGHPPGIAGLDQYDVLYADAKRWWEEGWVDYLTPQLYWPTARLAQSFPVLLGWWARHNDRGRHLWPGVSLSGIRDDAGRTELVNQIQITRGMLPGSPGICMFSMRSVERVAGTLREGPYARPALVPATPWRDGRVPAAPAVDVHERGDGVAVTWSPAGGDPVFRWVVHTFDGERWRHTLHPTGHRRLDLPADRPPTAVAVTAVDRCGNASEPVLVSVSSPGPFPGR